MKKHYRQETGLNDRPTTLPFKPADQRQTATGALEDRTPARDCVDGAGLVDHDPRLLLSRRNQPGDRFLVQACQDAHLHQCCGLRRVDSTQHQQHPAKVEFWVSGNLGHRDGCRAESANYSGSQPGLTDEFSR